MEMRHFLDKHGRGTSYVPHRKGSEHLQILAVVNFKGGSAKTTTSAHLAQHLALTDTGFSRSTSILRHRCRLCTVSSPKLTRSESLYEALCYDEDRKPLSLRW
jgi:chromosome partitioning protein